MNKNYEMQDCDEDADFLFKCILVGDSGVGKSSILLRYTTRKFRKEYDVTIGVEFACKNIQLDQNNNVKLQIWDTAGQESFRALVRSFYRNAMIVFLVYDVNKYILISYTPRIFENRRETFDNIGEWLEEIRQNADSNAVIALVGNKSDIGCRYQEVSPQEGRQFVEENSLSFFVETSALDGQNIDKAFSEATKIAFFRFLRDKIEVRRTRIDGKRLTDSEDDQNSRGCC